MDLEQKAIERISMASEMSLHHYGQPLVCTYSGGKDSDVMLELFKRSGIPFEVNNSHTTVDAPPTVYHIRDKFRELELQGIKSTITMPIYRGKRATMWNIIPTNTMPPTRVVRYCCKILKETACTNRMIATGIRWEESRQRSERKAFEALGKTKKTVIQVSETMLMSDNSETRKLIERCELKSKTVVNPIIDWTHHDVWEYIRAEKIKYNPLYDCGYIRVGCIGCPMAAKKRYKEFADFPTYKRAYIRAFDQMLINIPNDGVVAGWKTGEDVFLWWMEDKNIEGQMNLEDFGV